MKEQLVIAVRVIETDMTVTIDHARHHPATGRIDLGDRGIGRAVARSVGSDGGNVFALNQNVCRKWFSTGTVDHGAIFDEGIRLAHCIFPLLLAVG